MRPQRTYESIVRLLKDGGWRTVDDLRDVTSFPDDWIDELKAEGILEVKKGVVTMVRLRPRMTAGSFSLIGGKRLSEGPRQPDRSGARGPQGGHQTHPGSLMTAGLRRKPVA